MIMKLGINSQFVHHYLLSRKTFLTNNGWTAMKRIVLCCALLVCCGGCFLFFGDRLGTGKDISVTIPSRPGKGSPSPNSPEVQEAVQVVANLVVPYGLLQDTNTAPRGEHAIAHFHDQHSHTYCTMYLAGDTLTTFLFEYAQRASPEFKKLSSQVRKDLRSRYGFPRKRESRFPQKIES
jgi:hypothetical protein